MKKPVLILIVLAIILFFFKLGSFSLYDAIEALYGEYTKQIFITGDWMTLHFNGQMLFDKPPLYFWLTAMASYFFGFNEFAIRFWAAFCGVSTVIATYYLGKTFYNQQTGFLSAIIVMTAFQYLVQSRIAELDIVLVLFMTLSFLFFWQGYKEKKSSSFIFFYICLALATLTKGLIGFIIPVFTILLFLSIKKEIGRLKEIKIIPGLIIFLLIAAPWHIIEWIRYGNQFTEFIFGFLFMQRFGQVISGHPGPWYYYFFAIIFGFAPWSHFLPYSLWKTWKNRDHSPELLTLCFIVPVFIIFSIAKTKLPSYMLPLYPFLAISVGKLWDDFLQKENKNMYKGMAIANLLLAVVAILLIIGFALLGTTNYSGPYQQLFPDLIILAWILIIGCLLSIIFFFSKLFKTSFAILPVTVFIIALFLNIQLLPKIEDFKGIKQLSLKIKEIITPQQNVAAFNTGNRPSIVFYSPKTVIFLKTQLEAITFIKEKQGYLFTIDSEYEKIKHQLPKKTKSISTKGDLTVIYYE